MIATWYVEAGKYDVLPVDSRGTQRLAEPRPQIAVARTSYTYYPGTQMVPANAGPNVLNRPHSITADVEIPKGGAEGALLSAGDVQGGFSFYVQDGKLHYVYNYVGSEFYHVESNIAVPGGTPQAALRVRGDRQAGHQVRARGRRAAPSFTSTANLSDRVTFLSRCHSPLGLPAASSAAPTAGSPVWDKYKPPFKFTGTLYSATVDVSGELIKDDEATLRMHLARQ